MRLFVRSLVVVSSVFALVGQTGCGGGSEGNPDGTLTPRQLQERWKTEHEGRTTGYPATFELSGSPIVLTTEGSARVDAPSTLVTGPIFPDDKHYVFFADAQVGEQTGLLVLEGERIALTAGTLGAMALDKATARTHLEDGSSAPAVVLDARMEFGASDPSATFPADWSNADSALFFSDPVAVHPSNLTLTGFTRGVLVTASGSTPISGSVTVTSASRMFWDNDSSVESPTSLIDCPRFALGGAVDGGTLTASEFTSTPPLPGGVVGQSAQVMLQPGSARTEGSFQLTQAMTEPGLLLPAEVEVAFDTKPVTVKKGRRELVEVFYREKTMRGDAVLSDLQVTGTGKASVRVALDRPETIVSGLWDAVADSGIAGPIIAIPIAIVTPFVAIGEWLSCLLTTCPVAYPLWMKAGTVSRFHVIIQGDLPPGTYAADVTVTGRNYAAFTIPVHFTVTE